MTPGQVANDDYLRIFSDLLENKGMLGVLIKITSMRRC